MDFTNDAFIGACKLGEEMNNGALRWCDIRSSLALLTFGGGEPLSESCSVPMVT